jgi:hypothetical protein
MRSAVAVLTLAAVNRDILLHVAALGNRPDGRSAIATHLAGTSAPSGGIPGCAEEPDYGVGTPRVHHSAAVHGQKIERHPWRIRQAGSDRLGCAVLRAGFHQSSRLPNGKETNSGVLARIPDNPGRIFDWFIRPVGRKFIVGRYQAYGGPKPPPINHQGIESGGETASMILYRYRGKWLTLQGSD